MPGIGGVEMSTHGDTLDKARYMARDIVDGYTTICLRDDEDTREPQDRLPRGTGWDRVHPSSRVGIAGQIRRL